MDQRIEAGVWLKETEGLDAQGLLAWAVGRFGQGVALASSLGAEDQVVVDLWAGLGRGVRVFTLDTGRLPEETHEAIEATNRRYGIRMKVLFPERGAVEELVALHGPNGFYHSVENRRACCGVRKVEPLRRELATLGAWVTGLRREQAVTRAGVERIEWDEGNGLYKINPLADWSTERVWEYVRANGVPYNKLHDAGYPSIGCEPCTRAVKAGEDIRAGRWWWESPEHKECGLHVRDGKLVRDSGGGE